MWRLSVLGVRWLSDEPQPGWVEVEFTDSLGGPQRLQGKTIEFSDSWNRSTDCIPDGLEVDCEVIESSNTARILISIGSLPWLDEGTSFLVSQGQLRWHDG